MKYEHKRIIIGRVKSFLRTYSTFEGPNINLSQGPELVRPRTEISLDSIRHCRLKGDLGKRGLLRTTLAGPAPWLSSARSWQNVDDTNDQKSWILLNKNTPVTNDKNWIKIEALAIRKKHEAPGNSRNGAGWTKKLKNFWKC